MPGEKPALLFDIDSVLVESVDHFGEYGVSPRLKEEIVIVDGLTDVLNQLTEAGYLIVCHTNQPDIARKKITQKFLDLKHKMLQDKYPQIQDIFVCTHTETDLCNCRKPKSGLLRQAAKKHNIDFSLSWVIGDSRGDIEAGRMVHAKTILIQTDYNCGNPAIDLATAVAKNTKGACSLILALKKGGGNKHDV